MEVKRRNNSKKLAKVLIAAAFLLTVYSLHKELEGPATAIWSTTIPSAVGLYVSKQYNDRKWEELKTSSKEIKEEINNNA